MALSDEDRRFVANALAGQAYVVLPKAIARFATRRDWSC